MESTGTKLRRAIASRGWTQAKFAEIIGRSPQQVSSMVTDRTAIGWELSARIGTALGHPLEEWMRIQDEYQLWLLAENDEFSAELDVVRERAGRNRMALPGLDNADV